ncbi:MAG: (d)CMP kinase [Acholeplasmatales bacterium]|jgi:cytidylate kinase|nr:(d)CMP kinase [Acholeplasmatales bacterium]
MVGFILAIDGPAGSGKTTVSIEVARKLGWTHIDTGAMYRAVTYYALLNKIDLFDENLYGFLETIDINYKENQLYLNGINISAELRSVEVTKNVSLVSSLKVVRDNLVSLQRKVAAKIKFVVMDGRDIGTVVLPNANLKIYLTALIEERAKRRLLENTNVFKNSSLEEIIEDIKLRDFKDSNRDISPLTKSDDAIEIDTTYMTIDEVSDEIIKIIKSRRIN